MHQPALYKKPHSQGSVHNPRCEDQSASNLSATNILRTQALRLYIIRAVEQDDMNKAHPAQQRYDTVRHDNVLTEQPLGSDVATADSDEDNGLS